MQSRNEEIGTEEAQENNNAVTVEKDAPYIQLLAPKDDLPEDDDYVLYLKAALLKKESCNIALAGEYGSGKSSIIRSFLKHNNNKRSDEEKLKCISVSLATFKNEDVVKGELEKSILKQLFYKTDSESIPKSRFKRITDDSVGIKKTIMWLGAVVGILSPFIVCKFDSFYKIFLPGWNNIIRIMVLMVILGITLFTAVWILYQMLNNFNIKAIKASKNLNMEVEKKKEISEKENAFDINIDEIMYLFHEKKYDVVFFEDIDRFTDSIGIFTSLRELNEILNDTESLPWYKNEKKLKFVYAIKDDIFFEEKIDEEKLKNEDGKWNYKKGLKSSKIRTKFFDYIIPVMPITDSNNSYEYITEIFEKYNVENNRDEDNKLKISEGLQADISIYIDDMRLLQNTFNEFIIYHRKHIKTLLNIDKLFALVLYKNIYPVDFGKINKNDGDIYRVFKNKGQYSEEYSMDIDIEIEELKERMRKVDREWIRNKKELLNIYIKYKGNTQIYLEKENTWTYTTNLSENQIEDIRVSDRVISDIGDILNRFKILEDKEKMKEINLKIENLEKLKQKLQNMTIKELLEKNIKVFDEVIKDKEILRILLKRGYIAEDFESYMSIFKEGRMSLNDNKFLKMVTGKTEIWNRTKEYVLDNPENVIMRINECELSETESLNIQLLEFSIKNMELEKCKDRIVRYINQFEEIDDYKAEVIRDYIKRNDTTATQLIKNILKVNFNLFEEFKKGTNITKNDIDEVFKRIINCSDIDYIKGNLETYKKYIMNDSRFVYLDICNKNPEKIKELIEKLNIKFSYLINDISEYGNEIALFIYENNKYELNRDMIKFVIETQMKKICSEGYLMYGNILDTKLPNLIKFINDNIEEYVKKIYLEDNYKKDKEEAIIKLLNNENIDGNNKVKILKEKEFKISNLSDIKNGNLYRIIMKRRLLDITWENIEIYYKSNSSNEELTEYLNEIDIAEALSRKNLENIDIQIAILNDENISDENIRLLKKSFGEAFDSKNIFSYELSNERVELLIDIDMLKLTPEIYSEVSKNNKNKVKLILKYMDEFLEKGSEIYSININDFYAIIRNTTQDRKLKMLDKYDLNAIEVEKYYKELKTIIMKTSEDEYIKLKLLIKNAEIKELLENNKKITQRQLINKLSEVSNEYELKEKASSFRIKQDDELCEFKDELEERGFKIEDLENGEVKISISTKSKDQVAVGIEE